MKNIHIEATKYTPEILLDPENCVIEIRGKSYPENTFEFYKPVIEWLEEFFENLDKVQKGDMEMFVPLSQSDYSKYFEGEK